MKKLILPLAAGLALVTGCQYYEREYTESSPPQQVENPMPNPKFTMLRATTDENDLGDITLFCIDGITYVAVPGIGMSVKYKMDNEGDPYVETCINR